MPQAAENSNSSSESSSSSSSSRADTEMGLVDVCTIHCENESRCEGGPTTLDLTKSVFNKADCRNKSRKLVGNSKLLLLIGSPIDSGQEDEGRERAVLHLAFIFELYETQIHSGRYFFLSYPHSADSWEQSPVVDFMTRFPDTFQYVVLCCVLWCGVACGVCPSKTSPCVLAPRAHVGGARRRPRVVHQENKWFLNMSGARGSDVRFLIVNFLLTMNGPRRVIT